MKKEIVAKNNKRKQMSEKTKRKISETMKKKYSLGELKIKTGFKKGHIPKQKFLSKEKNINWKGDEAKYHALHKYVGRNKSKPKLCEDCKKRPPRDLANIKNHNYTRNIEDYKWLCHSCHKKIDLKEKRRKHKNNLIECVFCKKFKKKEDFYKHKQMWDGLSSTCKECYKKTYRKK